MVLACSPQGSTKPNSPPPKTRPASLKFKDYNLVFVSFDALQASHVSAYGYPRKTTPNIDAMAKQGTLFKRCLSVSSWTVPASMTWFTGVMPCSHRLTNKYAVYNDSKKTLAHIKELSPNLITLAESLKKRGYAPVAFTGNAGVSRQFGYSQGFDLYFHEHQKFGSMDLTVPKALEWLKKNKTKKFFLFLHGYDIHGQCQPKGGYDYRFREKDYDQRYRGSPQEQEALREEGLDKQALSLRPTDVAFWRACYDEKIQRADARFGQFLKGLTELGLTDKTLFVLTSDHGTELYEHHRFDHGFTLYQELIHVPLIISLGLGQGPSTMAGRVVNDQVSSLDVLPTILDLLATPKGSPLMKQCQGQSLSPALRGQSVDKEVYCETDYRQYTYKRAIVSQEGWKFILSLENQRRELYQLASDPRELNDLSQEQPARCKALEAKLRARFLKLGQDFDAQTWRVGLNPVYKMQGLKKN